MIVLLIYGLSILLFVLLSLWMFIPALYRLPLVTTNPEWIRKALKLVNLRPNETLYDLGAGDGGVLRIAAGLGLALALYLPREKDQAVVSPPALAATTE